MPDTDESTLLSPWLQEAGFIQDPFAFLIADDLSWDVLQEIYVFDEQVDRLLRDVSSAFFIFPPGGGQTTSQAYARYAWETSRPNSITAIYNQFETAVNGLPNVRLDDHANGLFGAVSKAVWEHLFVTGQLHKTTILRHCWWWKFLAAYLAGETIEFRLRSEDALLQAFAECLSRPYQLFAKNSEFTDKMRVVGQRLGDINLERLLFLVNGFGNQQFHSPEDIFSLAHPFLSSPHLYINSNPITWKLFFPELIKDSVINSLVVQKDRVHHMEVAWKPAKLETLLRNRLEWASNGDVHSLALLSEEISDLDVQLANLAWVNRAQFGPPRTLLKLSTLLLKGPGQLISRSGWQRFQQMHTLAPTSSKDVTNPNSIEVERTQLRRTISTYFNPEELENLIFELDIESDKYEGLKKEKIIIQLIEYCERHNLYQKLVTLVCNKRPALSWCQKRNGERETPPDETEKGRRV